MTARPAGARPLAIVLHERVEKDAPADEQDTLVQAAAVADALRVLGYRVQRLAFGPPIETVAARLRRLSPAIVFNLVESVNGDGRLVYLAPALLEALGIPFTGAGAGAHLCTGDKLLAKRILAAGDIATPEWVETPARARAVPAGSEWIVKPVHEDASAGIDAGSVVRGPRRLGACLAACRGRGRWFAERYIPGRELNVALLEDDGRPRALPVSEIHFVDFPAGRPCIVDYEAKWVAGSFAWEHTPRSFEFDARDAPLLETLRETALRAWRLFDLRGYARVDFRVDADGSAWMLEVNANPCLSPDAGFVAAAAQAGLDLAGVVQRVIAAALRSAAAHRAAA